MFDYIIKDWSLAVSDKLPECLEDAINEEELTGFLQKLNIEYEKPKLKTSIVVFPYDGELYVYDNIVKLAKQWIYEIDVDKYVYQDYNEDFWRFAIDETVVYHGTTPENLNNIWAKGKLEKKYKTRGISNRHVGPCVFCSCEKDSAEQYVVVIEVLVGRMKCDGWMPEISIEPAVQEYEARESIASLIGLDDFSQDLESGIYPDTVIFHEDIPIKYLRLSS